MKHSVDGDLGRQVQQVISGEVFFNEPMNRHASLGVGGNADVFACPENEREVVGLVGFLVDRDIPFYPVGNCTNLVVRDGGYRGVLISLRRLQGLEMRTDSMDEILLYAEAGVSLARLTEFTLRESLAGLEFCAGIPGTLGGALRMNAGAWGSEMKNIVSSVHLLAPGRKIEEIPRSRLSFSYRNLDLPRGGVITAALLALRRGRRESIKTRVEEIMAERKKRHPLTFRSAGSVFKNPAGTPAGRLIEETGLKGLRVGDAVVSEQHGNFIVNAGAARAHDILALIEIVRRTVKERRGIELETEIVIIGDEQ